MYNPIAEQVAADIRALIRRKLPRELKQAMLKTLLRPLKPASRVNTIRSLLDSGDAIEQRSTLVSAESLALPPRLCDGDPLIHIFNGMALVTRCHVAGDLQIDDQGQLVYEAAITIETARNWEALEFDAWLELQSTQVGRAQEGYFVCSPALLDRAIFDK